MWSIKRTNIMQHKAGHKRGSNCVPPTSMQSLQRRRWPTRTWSNKCGCLEIISVAPCTLAMRSSSDVTGVAYTKAYILPHRKELCGERSGDRAGHGTGPPLSIHRFGYVTLRWFLTFLSKCAGAPSCCSHITCRISSGTASNKVGNISLRNAR